jgi:hypothetical protein
MLSATMHLPMHARQPFRPSPVARQFVARVLVCCALFAATRQPRAQQPRTHFNEAVPGTEAAPQYYARVNPESDFTPRRGGVNAPGGPAPMRLMLATSRDGLSFERRNLIVTDQGAVPDLAVDRSGRIWLYYQSCAVGDEVNRVALAVSGNGGASWTFRRVHVSGFPAPKPDPCDPDVVILPDGAFHLFLTCAERGNHPCSYLAEGRDGTSFTAAGRAFDPGATALDPSVARIGDTWHIFSGGGRGPGENWHGVSGDGRGFTAAAPVRLMKDGFAHMIANGLEVDDGWRAYAFNNPRPGEAHRINSFLTRDGVNWTPDPGTRLSDGGLPTLEQPGFGPQDPAVGRLPDGTVVMVYTTRIPGLPWHR